MDRDDDLFPEIQPECWRALASVKAPELLALVQLCAELARFFCNGGKVGPGAVVDAARLFGGAFNNNARRLIGAAARIRTDIPLPEALTMGQDVRLARIRIANQLVPGLTKALEFIERVGRGQA